MPLTSFADDPSILTQTMPVDPMEQQALAIIEQALHEVGIVPDDQVILDPNATLESQIQKLIDAVPLE